MIRKSLIRYDERYVDNPFRFELHGPITETPVNVPSYQGNNLFEWKNITGAMNVLSADVQIIVHERRYLEFYGHINVDDIDQGDEIQFYISLKKAGVYYRMVPDSLYVVFSIHDNISDSNVGGVFMKETINGDSDVIDIIIDKNNVGSNGQHLIFNVHGGAFLYP